MGRNATLVERQCGNGGDQLLRGNADGSCRRTTAASQSHHADSRYVRSLRVGNASWLSEQRLYHALSFHDWYDIRAHQQTLAQQINRSNASPATKSRNSQKIRACEW